MFRIPRNTNRVMSDLNRELAPIYSELQRYGVQRIFSRRIVNNIISFILENEGSYTGSREQRTNQMVEEIRRANYALVYALRLFNVPQNRVNEILRDIVRIVLNYIGEPSAPLLLLHLQREVGVIGKILAEF